MRAILDLCVIAFYVIAVLFCFWGLAIGCATLWQGILSRDIGEAIIGVIIFLAAWVGIGVLTLIVF